MHFSALNTVEPLRAKLLEIVGKGLAVIHTFRKKKKERVVKMPPN